MPRTFSCQLLRAVSSSTGPVHAGGTPGAQHAEAVTPRQADVQHDGRIGLDRAQVLGVDAVVGQVDRKACGLQRGLQLQSELALVLDHQHPHRWAPCLAVRRCRRRAGRA